MLNMLTRSLAAKKARLAEEEKGFTLIELLVVVIIIGILAAIAIPIFLGQQEQAKGSAVESAIANAKVDVVSVIVEGDALPDGAALSADDGDDKITLTIGGTAEGFCIAGTHSEVTGKSWAADDSSGVVEGTCTAVAPFVVVPAP